MFSPSSKVAAAVEGLTEALLELSAGETITFARMSRAAKQEVTSTSYVLQRALKRAEEESGAIFDNVRGKGYQRLASEHIPSVGKKANGRLRRVARRARKRLDNVRANDLNPSQVGAIAAYRAHFGMIESMAKESAVRALEVVIEKPPVKPAANVAERTAALMKRG